MELEDLEYCSEEEDGEESDHKEDRFKPVERSESKIREPQKSRVKYERKYTFRWQYSEETSQVRHLREAIHVKAILAETHENSFEYVTSFIAPNSQKQRKIVNIFTADENVKKPLGCKVCGKRFTRNQQLNLHMQDHSSKFCLV